MPFLKTNGVNTHYEDNGAPSAKTIVFANSLGTDFRIWNDVIAPLPKEVRVIRYDKRGHGLSECPPHPYSINDLASDVQSLLRQLNVTNCLFVGLSIGGLIAQELILNFPGLVRAAVLSNTAAKIGNQEMWQTRIEMAQSNKLAEMAPSIIERWFSRSFRQNEPAATEGWQAMLSRMPGEGYAGCCHAIMAADFSDKTASFDLPIWVIAGSEDGATPPNLVRATAELIPNCRYLEFDGAGHLTCVEEPKKYSSHLGKIMEEVFTVG